MEINLDLVYNLIMSKTAVEKRQEILENVSEEFSLFWYELHKDFPPVLWHYTDAGGLLGMLQNNQLWFTDAKCLNDYSEMSYAITVIEEIINEHLQNENYSPLVVEYLKDMLASVLYRVRSDKEMGFMNPAFVCCFCEEKDSLHLWRAYTNNGRGYSIGFFVDFIYHRMLTVKIKEQAVTANKRFIETLFTLDPYFCRVIYEKEKQRRIINKLIEMFVKAITENPDAFPPGNLNNFPKSAALSKIYSLFYLCLFCFKSPSFAGEREWRLVYARRLGSISGMDDIPSAEIHYRVSGNYIVPYLKVDAGRTIEIQDPKDAPVMKRLVFETIYCGPGIDYELAHATINSYVLRNGYLGTNIHVEKSSVPLRSMQ